MWNMNMDWPANQMQADLPGPGLIPPTDPKGDLRPALSGPGISIPLPNVSQ